MSARDRIFSTAALLVLGALCTGVVATSTTLAGASDVALDLRTPAPVIHLAANLDEADGLGWCIDTVGRGFNPDLHAHSCKPQGGDVQFAFDAEAGLIRSVAFREYCVTTRPDGVPTAFGLSSCAADAPAQRFTHDSDTGALSPLIGPDRCMAVGQESSSAGPFLSRDLELVDCSTAPSELIRWVIVN